MAGLVVRWWQLGIQMRPFFARPELWVYPIYGGVGASFGYWLQSLETNRMRYLGETKERLLERRKRRAEREQLNAGNEEQKSEHGMIASPTS